MAIPLLLVMPWLPITTPVASVNVTVPVGDALGSLPVTLAVSEIVLPEYQVEEEEDTWMYEVY